MEEDKKSTAVQPEEAPKPKPRRRKAASPQPAADTPPAPTDSAELPGGTYTARAMFYGVGGEFAALDGYWTLEGGEELTLRTALPVTLRDGTQQTLPAGTKLHLTGSDRESIADFETENGVQGTLELEKQRGYDGWYIEGKKDTELFS